MLCLVLSGQCGQTAHLLDIRYITLTFSRVAFAIGDLAKTSRPGSHLDEVSYLSYAPDCRLCIVTVLKTLFGTHSWHQGLRNSAISNLASASQGCHQRHTAQMGQRCAGGSWNKHECFQVTFNTVSFHQLCSKNQTIYRYHHVHCWMASWNHFHQILQYANQGQLWPAHPVSCQIMQWFQPYWTVSQVV